MVETPASESCRYEELLVEAGFSERVAGTLAAGQLGLLKWGRENPEDFERSRRNAEKARAERRKLRPEPERNGAEEAPPGTPGFDARQFVRDMLPGGFTKRQAQVVAAGQFGVYRGSWADIDGDLERIRRLTDDLREESRETEEGESPAPEPGEEGRAEDQAEG